mgnify:CR=1 FL=1
MPVLTLVLVALAKDQWKKDNPERSNLPAHSDDKFELRFFGTKRGSCLVPISFRMNQPDMLFHEVAEDDLPAKLPAAARRLHGAYACVASRKPIPDDFPADYLADLKALGSTLGEDDTATILIDEPLRSAIPVLDTRGNVLPPPPAPPEPVVLDAALRAEVERVVNAASQVEGIFTGEVRMASTRGRGSLFIHEFNREIQIECGEGRVEELTDALHRHKEVRLRVHGVGELDPKLRCPKKLVVDDFVVLPIPNPDAPSRNAFERWAAEDPPRLVRSLTDGSLPDTLLTFAAEIAGEALPSAEVVPALRELLAHASPLVREGAIYGLARHPSAELRTRLRAIAEADSSPGVRSAAEDVLESIS